MLILAVSFWYIWQAVASTYFYEIPTPTPSNNHYVKLESEAWKRASDPKFQAKYPIQLTTTPELLENIARKILRNETSCRRKDLIIWSGGEIFPSLGLPHAIWFPQGVTYSARESFPDMVTFIKAGLDPDSKVPWPAWLNADNPGHAPWKTRKDFESQKNGAKTEELRAFLAHPDVLKLQADFIVDRLRKGIHAILAYTELENRPQDAQRIYRNFNRLAQSDFGIRAMADYVNFKGEGIAAEEKTHQYKMQWGLKQILERMPTSAPNAYQAFANEAQIMLTRITVNNRPRSRSTRERWLAGGWTRRVNETYRTGRLDQAPCSELFPEPPPTPVPTPSSITSEFIR